FTVTGSRWPRLVGGPWWCGRRDSNPHDFRHGNLNPARLPIPPRPQRAASLHVGRDCLDRGASPGQSEILRKPPGSPSDPPWMACAAESLPAGGGAYIMVTAPCTIKIGSSGRQRHITAGKRRGME